VATVVLTPTVTPTTPLTLSVALPTPVVVTGTQAADSPFSEFFKPLPSQVITIAVPTIAVATPMVASKPTEEPAVPPTDPPATATVAATAAPTDSPTATLLPVPTTTPTITPTPIDVAAVIYTNLPPVFVGASILLLGVITMAGISIIRGPRDI
jgi:hypothetical protein